MIKWTSVANELPKDSEQKLCYREGDGFYFCRFENRKFFYLYNDGYEEPVMDIPSHWAEINKPAGNVKSIPRYNLSEDGMSAILEND